ncbi:MAG: serine--tRNA ligase [Flavobacteriia bacterium]|nr:serine--tRNA ligase [Flavobacteriia bacterium]
MLEIQKIRSNKEQIIEALNKRFFPAEKFIQELLDKDNQWRKNKTELETITSELNKFAKNIGELMKNGQKELAEQEKEKSKKIKEKESELKSVVEELEKEIQLLLYQIPNTPNELVKAGKSAEDNEEIFTQGQIPKLHEKAVPHWDLAQQYNLINFELGVKITGAGFPVYLGKGAKLQRALIQFFLDEACNAGYEEYMPPIVVNEASGFGTGQLPDKEGQMYYMPADDLYMIPTAEVPVTNIFREVLLPDENFSFKMCAYTPCFRREAGSYGKDVRGLNRLHQFDKVEIVRIEHPDNTAKALEEMLEHVKNLLMKLELPFRILRLCGGDMGFSSAMTYDFEVYSAAQQKWLEVSSVSRFDTFQSNRLKLRFKTKDKKTVLCHTLNGSALALPRIVAALLENFQDEKGIKIPKALIPYTGFDRIEH